MSDLIERQAAIDAVEKESQVDGAYGYMDTKSIVDLLNDLSSAQPEPSIPISWIKKQIDLIERQAAIEAIEDHIKAYTSNMDVYNIARRHMKELIEVLPSAQSEQKTDKEFVKLTVRDSNGRPYYSIIYLEVDKNGVVHDFEGYSSYSLDTISDYLRREFGFALPTAQPEIAKRTAETAQNVSKSDLISQKAVIEPHSKESSKTRKALEELDSRLCSIPNGIRVDGQDYVQLADVLETVHRFLELPFLY